MGTTPERRTVVEGAISLPFGLCFRPEASGLTVPVAIGAIELTLEMPKLIDGPPGKASVVPPVFVNDPIELTRFEDLVEPMSWGSAAGWSSDPSIHVRKFMAKKVLIRLNFTQPQSPAIIQCAIDELVSQVDGWFGRLISWIEVGTGNTLSSSPRTEQAGGRLRAWTGDHAVSVALTSGLWLSASLEPSVIVELSVWGRALTAASNDFTPPIEYTFLRSARAALVSGDFRRAVLDAATAAEIAMIKLRDERAKRGPVAGNSRQRSPGIGRLVSILRSSNIAVPRGTEKAALADPRNQAIHQGIPPSLSQAERAVATAETLVHDASPSTSLF